MDNKELYVFMEHEGNGMGIDKAGHLYWNGKEIQTKQVFSLSTLERLLAGIAALSAVILAIVEILRFFGYGHHT